MINVLHGKEVAIEYNKNSIIAKSGKTKYKFDITQENFAWISESKVEKKMIRINQ